MTSSFRRAIAASLAAVLAISLALTSVFFCAWLRTPSADGARLAVSLARTNESFATCATVHVDYRLLAYRACCDDQPACEAHRLVRGGGVDHSDWVWAGRATFGALLAGSMALLVAFGLRLSGRRGRLASAVAITLAAIGCVIGAVFSSRHGWGTLTLVHGAGLYVAGISFVFTVVTAVLLRSAPSLQAFADRRAELAVEVE